MAMTYIDEPEVRRASRGTKVLGFGFAILAVLGSFWGIVWFIRTYVEPPRVMMPSPLALASRDSTPVALASPAQTKRTEAATDKATPAPAPAAADPADRTATTGGIADRWAPLTQTAPAASPITAPAPTIATVATAPTAAETAPAPTMSAATSLTTAPDADVIEEVAEGSVPAISGPAPLPRRRPTVTTAAAAKRSNTEPPLPRPRPDGPAPQSVFTAVPVADDRFPTQ
jgi:cytoskeletal protein RodZ